MLNEEGMEDWRRWFDMSEMARILEMIESICGTAKFWKD